MQIYLDVNAGLWYARWPSGRASGWSLWESYNRQGALTMIELGYEFERGTGLPKD